MSKPLALIVEDNIDLAAIMAIALRGEGFEVEMIHDGGKALARLAEVIPALVILDLHLPHLSGANTLRQIQTDMRLLNTRVVIATADAAMADELRDKADLVLLKPVSIAQIRELAARLIPSARASQAEEKPETQAETKPEAQVEAKPEAQVEAKPEAQVEAKPEAQVEAKLEAQVETKPETQAGAKPEAQPASKPEKASLQPPGEAGAVKHEA